MKNFKKILATSLLLIFCCLSTSNVFAQDNYGKPIYRDGVALIEWHAGLSGSSDGSIIYHVVNYSDSTRITDYDGFLDDNEFMGVYYKPGMDQSDYDDVLSTASRLINYSIPYDFYTPVDHNESSGYISPSEVTAFRCDGFVEYCYEWNNHKVMCWGSNGQIWDISEVEDNESHTWYNMSPKSQSSFLTKYSSTIN